MQYIKILLVTFIFLLLSFLASSSTYAASYNVMTMNYKYIKPHNIEILKKCVAAKNIDFFGFQEMNFMDGTTLASMKNSLSSIGYRSDSIDTAYTVGRREHLVIFYKDIYQYLSGPETTILGGGAGQNDDTRKILTGKLHDPVNNIDLQVFNHHPVSGENEQSCSHNKVSIGFVNQYNSPYSIFFGDFNLKLNADTPQLQTSCNALFSSQFSISCRPGETTTHTPEECGGKGHNYRTVIDFIMTPLNGNMRVTDSYYDTCGFSIGDSGSFDSDHMPLFATLTADAQVTQSANNTPIPTPSPTAPSQAPSGVLKVMTFNTLSSDGVLGNVKELSNFIKTHDLDLIGFQEAGGLDKVMQQLQKISYPMYKMETSYLGGKRIAIFSKYPMSQQYTFPFSGDRVFMKSQIDTPFGPVQAYNMHPPQGPGPTCDGLKVLLAQTAQFPQQAIVMGDFNFDFNSQSALNQCPTALEVNDKFDRSCADYTKCRYAVDDKGRPRFGIIDWILTRKQNGLTITNSQRLNGDDGAGISFSDHTPTYAEVAVEGTSSQSCTVPPSAPVITNPLGDKVGAGAVTITWNPSATATKYALRIDDTTNGFSNSCGVTQNPGDVCDDNVTGTSYTYTFIAGRRYHIWLHALNSCGGWDRSSSIGFDVVPASQITPPLSGAACKGYVPPPVQITSPANTTLPAGSYEVAWSPSSCATKYSVRIDDLLNPWVDSFPCDASKLNPGDACVDNLTSTTMGQYNFVQGHTYRIWVHAINDTEGWNVVGAKTISVVAPTQASDKCVIQGFKLPEFGLNPGGEYWTFKGDIANAQVSVAGDNVTLDAHQSASTENPYFLAVPGNKSYTVTLQAPPGYDIASTYCSGAVTCHGATSPARQAGTIRTSVLCPAGSWADVWWHFTPQATPTPVCAVPEKPKALPINRHSMPYGSNEQLTFSWERDPKTQGSPATDTYKIALKENINDLWVEKNPNYDQTAYSIYVDSVQSVGIQVKAKSTCGDSEALEMWSTPSGTPTPAPGTLQPTSATCRGVQHCTDGKETLSGYCGSCSGQGCSGGYTCEKATMTCKTFANKVHEADELYELPCSQLTPTPEVKTVGAWQCGACTDEMPYWCLADDPLTATDASICSSVSSPAKYHTCSYKCDSTQVTADPKAKAPIPSASKGTYVMVGAAAVATAVVAAFLFGL